MRCPECGKELRQSKKYPSYGLCDTCKKKYKLPDEGNYKEGSSDYTPSRSNVPPTETRAKIEKKTKKNYDTMVNSGYVEPKKNGGYLKTGLIVLGAFIVLGIVVTLFLWR